MAEAQFGISRDLIIGKTAFDIFPKAAADIIAADDERTLQSPDGLFKDEHVWETQGMGPRYITSRRLGIPQCGRGRRATSSTSSTTLPSAGSPTRRSRISRITTR